MMWCHFFIIKAYILENDMKVILDNHDKLSQKTKLKDQAPLTLPEPFQIDLCTTRCSIPRDHSLK